VNSGFITAEDLSNHGAPTSTLEFWMTAVPTRFY
jgi:hypothetical protein